ncbi:MAG: DNA-3-methyladenine glycosylase [Candidatus Saccharibacteria bacterium]|jgi:DNA-3-methyladenine glycosylase|nr:DNA-3-methyladenine glycosylase [Candidatus Saccharibacteria bacterium]
MASDRVISRPFEALKTGASLGAKRLLGCLIEREIDGKMVQLKIVETEAYDQTDAASHSYNGRTPRIETMFGPAGHLYVYFTYGMHYCCNVVVGEDGHGAAVLIRAAEPITNVEILEKRRVGKKGVDLTNGPAKLCQALDINLDLNGHDLSLLPFRLVLQPELLDSDITTTTRVGINKAKDTPWRFYVTDNPYVSVKVRDSK